jgi:hypothetical protein
MVKSGPRGRHGPQSAPTRPPRGAGVDHRISQVEQLPAGEVPGRHIGVRGGRAVTITFSPAASRHGHIYVHGVEPECENSQKVSRASKS